VAVEIKIQVGFEGNYRELTVKIPDGDIAPYAPGAELRVVGKPENRLDAIAKATGTAKYASDQRPAGMLYGAILRSPHANADITLLDTSTAEQMPGVKAVLKVPEVFQTSSCRYAGAEVAAVAAETEAIAEEALRSIFVEYEVLPFAVTLEDAMAAGAPRVGRRDQENVVRASPGIPRQQGGAVDEAREREIQSEMRAQEEKVDALLRSAPVTVSNTYTTTVQTHCPLEPHGVVCEWRDGKLICWASTQATFGVQGELASPRGPVGADTRVHCEHVGGGFGSKFGAGREGVLGALLAKEAGAPVRMMLDRRGEQTAVGNRPDSKQQLTLGLDREGKILAYKVRNWGTPGTGTGGAGAHNDVIYSLGEIDKVEYGVRTNAGDARAHRAPGFPQGAYGLESILDEAAAAIGMDPIELRRRNDDHPVRKAGYDLAAKRAGWAEKRAKSGDATAGSVKRGIGVASSLWFAAGGGGGAVLVRLRKDGRVEVRNGAQDIGTGTRTVLGQVAAEELGLPLAGVQVFIGDTADPRGPGSGGSTTIGSLTPAARLAAHRTKRRLLEIVAERKGWDAANLDLRGEQVVDATGKALLPFAAACALLDEDAIEILAERPVLGRREPNYAGFADTNAGVQIAEVAVDTETGEVRVERVTAVADAGKILNPKLAESQVRGGVIQGVSFALFERRVMDRQEGRMVNADMEQYKILGSVDCPEIDVVLVDVHNGKNNTGVMGLGEPPIVATAAAVANAVAHAIGVRIPSLPITPRKVLEALGRVPGAAKGAKL